MQPEPYSAIVLGEQVEVCGYDADGLLLLGSGDRYLATPLGLAADLFRSFRLRRIASLTFTGGRWLLDGKDLEEHWVPLIGLPRSSETDTELFSLWTLRDILKGNPGGPEPIPGISIAQFPERVSAVAWVEERYTHYAGQQPAPGEKPKLLNVGGSIVPMVTAALPDAKGFEPIFLESFRRIASAALPRKPPQNQSKAHLETKPTGRRFRVALSFAGPNRPFVEEVAAILAEALGRDRVFYDKYYESELARPNLDTYLADIYRKESDLVVPFISAAYGGRVWCNLEWRQMRDILLNMAGDRLMYFRFDQAELPGLLALDGYADISKRTPQEAANLILERLGQPAVLNVPKAEKKGGSWAAFIALLLVAALVAYLLRAYSRSENRPSTPQRSAWEPPELPPNCTNVLISLGGVTLNLPIILALVPPEPSSAQFPMKDLPPELTRDVDKLTNYSPRIRRLWLRRQSMEYTIGGKKIEFPIAPLVRSNRLYIQVDVPFQNTKRTILMSDDFDPELCPLPRLWDRNYSSNRFELVNEHTNPVLQVIYKRPNEVQVNGIFLVDTYDLLVSFGALPVLLSPQLAFSDGQSTQIVDPRILSKVCSNLAVSVDTNAAYGIPFPDQKPIFKYPSWKYPGLLADAPNSPRQKPHSKR